MSPGTPRSKQVVTRIEVAQRARSPLRKFNTVKAPSIVANAAYHKEATILTTNAKLKHKKLESEQQNIKEDKLYLISDSAEFFP